MTWFFLTGLAECVFVGWVYGAERLRDETRAVSGHAFMGVGSYFPVTIKYVVPVALVTMLSYQIAAEAVSYTHLRAHET